ncbi:MAG: ThiF family adenylyltransferase [Francisellaceae bacterium]
MTESELQRYQRHFSVIGIDGQKKLKNASVCIIGCGGIGSPLALYLTAAGIGRLTLIDFDVVSLSNLQRQILFSEANIGQLKVKQAKNRLKGLNAEIEITPIDQRLDFDLAMDCFSHCDLVIDGSDNYETRFLISDVCCRLSKPFISASVLKSQAQLAFFDSKTRCYRCLYESPPPAHLSPSCAEAGIIGAVVGVVGTMAATMALNFLLEKAISTELMCFDGDRLKWQYFSYPQRANCSGCLQQAYRPVTKRHQHDALDVSWVDMDHLNHDADVIFDVREAWEIELNPLPYPFIHIPLSDFLACDDFTEFTKKNHTIALFCKAGIRSKEAAIHMNNLGYKKILFSGFFNAN